MIPQGFTRINTPLTRRHYMHTLGRDNGGYMARAGHVPSVEVDRRYGGYIPLVPVTTISRAPGQPL